MHVMMYIVYVLICIQSMQQVNIYEIFFLFLVILNGIRQSLYVGNKNDHLQ